MPGYNPNPGYGPNPNPIGQLGQGQGFLSRTFPGPGGVAVTPEYGNMNPLTPQVPYAPYQPPTSSSPTPPQQPMWNPQRSNWTVGPAGGATYPPPMGAGATTGGAGTMQALALNPAPAAPGGAVGGLLNDPAQVDAWLASGAIDPGMADQLRLIAAMNQQSGMAAAAPRLMGLQQTAGGTYFNPSLPGSRPPSDPGVGGGAPPPSGGGGGGGGGGGNPPPAGGGGGAPAPAAGSRITPELINDILTNPRYALLRKDFAANPQGLIDQLRTWESLSPGIGFGPTGLSPESDPDDQRGLLLRAMAGPMGYNDPYKLPGESIATYQLLNLLQNEAVLGGKRAATADQTMEDYARGAAASKANLLNERLLGDLSANPHTTSSDALKERLINRATGEIEAGRNIGRNRLQDLGYAGMGPAGTDSMRALDDAATNARYNAMLDLENEFAKRRATDIEAGQKAAMGGADIYGALIGTPALQRVGLLRAARNPALGGYLDALGSTAEAEVNKELAFNKGTTAFETIAPLLGAGIGAAGNILGANSLSGGLNSLSAALKKLVG